MKRIVIEGTKDKVKRFVCPRCRCIFDSDEYHKWQFDDHAPVYFISNCPCCGVQAYEFSCRR